jgi:putative ABC transport system permease protein
MQFRSRITLAVKYLAGYFRRYRFLLLAVCFSFAIITVITSLIEGMARRVFMASQSHYSGQVFVLGFDKEARTQGRIGNRGPILAAIGESGVPIARTVIRTNCFGEGILYFAGTEVRQKYVMGVDWEAEAEDFRKMAFVDGGVPEQGADSDILISGLVAGRLSARVGDDVVLEVLTKSGQKNTGTFIVRGITRDNGIFGTYKCIVGRKALNRLLAYDADDCSSIGLFFDSNEDLDGKAGKIYSALKTRIPMGAPIGNKQDLTYQLSLDWPGIRYFVLTIDIYVSEVADLLTAIKAVSYFLYVMMVAIVLASTGATYRMILHERLRELGTMLTIGLQAADARSVLVLECVILFFLAMASGFFLSLAILWVLSLFSFSWIPGFDIFMDNGRLAPSFSVSMVFTNVVILLTIVIPFIWLLSFRASRMRPIKSLAGGDR